MTATYQTFPALGLSEILGWSVKLTPRFATDVVKTALGFQRRRQAYARAIYELELTYEVLRAAATYSELQTIVGFFDQMQGQCEPFWIALPGIAKAVNQPLGVGDGSTTVFGVYRTWGTYVEEVDGLTSVDAIYLNGTPISPSDATVSTTWPNLITFATAPGSGVHITMDFHQLWLMRFSEDMIKPSEFMSMLWELKTLKMESSRPHLGDDTGMTAFPTLFLFDKTCHLYTSADGGVTFVETETPLDTLSGTWPDMAMAVNDGDYSTTSLYCEAVSQSYNSDFNTAATFRGGALIAANGSVIATSPILNFSGGLPDDGAFRILTGAITANAETILVASWISTSSTNTVACVPMLSTDQGKTFALLTGAPSVAGAPGGSAYAYCGAALSQNASVMYLALSADKIYKSTDGGSTWTATGSPTLPTVDGTNLLRLRCSQNGGVVAYSDYLAGVLHISHNGGSMWTSFDAATTSGAGGTSIAADFGMSLDGSVFFCSYAAQVGASVSSFAWKSTDGGATWQSQTLPNPTQSAVAANCSPDGQGFLIGYEATSSTATADFSLNQGRTWSSGAFALSQLPGSTGEGAWVSAYILPPAPAPTRPPVVVDGSASSADSTVSSTTVALTTTKTDDIIMLVVHAEQASLPSISSVSDAAGLTWHLRNANNVFDSGNSAYNDMEIWWAHAPAALTGDVITVTFSIAIDDCSLVAFGLHGANTSAPFDANGSLPGANSTTGGPQPNVSGVSTNAAASTLIFAASSSYPIRSFGYPFGFNQIEAVDNQGGNFYSELEVAQMGQFSTLASKDFAIGGGFTSGKAWLAYVDAVVPA